MTKSYNSLRLKGGFTPLHSQRKPSVSELSKGGAAFRLSSDVNRGIPKRSVTGFTLLELLIVIAIVSVLATAGVVTYANSQRKVVLTTSAEHISSVLRLARQRAVGQEQGLEWGVHFENPAGGAGFYEIFKGASYSTSSVTEKFFLQSPVIFSQPASGNSINVIFSKRTGTTDAQYDIVILMQFLGASRTIRTHTSGISEVL